MDREQLFCRIRLASIEAVVKFRHGARGCRDDDGEMYLELAAATFASGFLPEDIDRLWSAPFGPWCRRLLPAVPEAVARAALAEALARPRRITGPVAGRMLRVTDEERLRLSLRTLGSTADSVERRKEKDRKRAERRRRKAGAVSREDYIGTSATTIAAACGVSRRVIWNWIDAGPDHLQSKLRQYLSTSYPDAIVRAVARVLIERRSKRDAAST